MKKNHLERQYSPSAWSHRLAPDEVVDYHCLILEQESRKCRENLVGEFGISYGDSDEQRFDWFTAAHGPSKCLLVYLHGGYWQALSVGESSFMARTIVEGGINFVALGYDLAPHVGLTDIVRQVRIGLQAVLVRARTFGIDHVFLCGHSAGGHLAALVPTNEPPNTGHLPSDDLDLIKGLILISGVFDLTPLVDIPSVNDALKLIKEEADTFSPITYMDRLTKFCATTQCRVMVAYAEHDPTQFHKQSQEFCRRLDSDKQEELLILGVDHFDIVERLIDPNFELAVKILEFINQHYD